MQQILRNITKRNFVSICPNVSNIPVSPTLHINETVKQLKDKGKQVYHFGFGQSPFPVPLDMVNDLKKYANEKDYLPTRGLYELRETISSHLKTNFNVSHFSSNNIMIGPGSKQLIYQIFTIFDGEIFLPSPSWVSYYPQCKLARKDVRILNTSKENNWHITPDELDKQCQINPSKPKMILLNTPCNPTGQYYSKNELEELTKIFRKYKIIVIADEIYGLLHFNNIQSSISSFYPEGTIVCSGISKAFGAGGWRLGFSAFPKELSEYLYPMDCIASETFSAVSAPIQYASISAFKSNKEIIKILQQQRSILSGVANYVHKTLENANVNVLLPQGGFYMFPDFEPFRNKLKTKNIINSNDLCQYILKETGVAILPGNAFLKDPLLLYARLAFVNFDGKNALEELEKLQYNINEPVNDNFVKEICPETVKGIDNLCSWLQSL